MAELTVSPLPEWELWACANAAIGQHGDGAASFAKSRADDLAREGAAQGATTWRLILDRIQQLRAAPSGKLH